MTYEDLRRDHPELFATADDAAIRLDPGGAREGLLGVIYADQYLVLLREPVVFADGRPGTYLRLLEQPLGVRGVAVLPRHGDRIVLLRHFRHATRRDHLEIPRGYGCVGVNAEDSARRELLEEIGGRARQLFPLGALTWNSGLSNGAADLFFAELNEIGQPERAEGVMDILLLEPRRVEEMIASGEIADSFTLGAWARARLRGLV